MAQEWASNPKIVAVVGPESDGTVDSAGPILGKAGLAMVSSTATSSRLTDGKYPTFYRVIPPDSLQGSQDADYMIDTIDRADAAGASLVVFTLRTPGGLVDSTRAIVTRMIAARSPIAVLVAPSGARAASAGFLLTIAADVAAMAPGTHIGAAHPVEGDGQKIDEVLAKKATEDLAAYARTLAYLVKKGAAVEAKDIDGMTPLLYAVRSRHKESYDELVRLGADPRVVDKLGRTGGQPEGQAAEVQRTNSVRDPFEEIKRRRRPACLAFLDGRLYQGAQPIQGQRLDETLLQPIADRVEPDAAHPFQLRQATQKLPGQVASQPGERPLPQDRRRAPAATGQHLVDQHQRPKLPGPPFVADLQP